MNQEFSSLQSFYCLVCMSMKDYQESVVIDEIKSLSIQAIILYVLLVHLYSLIVMQSRFSETN